MKWSFVAVLLAACAPEPAQTELRADVLSSVGEILHPAEVYVRFDEPKSELTVFEKLEGAQLAQGPAAQGTKLAFTLEGRACELESAGPRIETDTVEKNTSPVAPVRDPGYRTRQTKMVKVTLRCADGLPPPGIKAPPSVPGWSVTLWMLGAIALGLALGKGWTSSNSMVEAAVVLVALPTVVVSVLLLWSRLDGGLVLSLPVLGLTCGGAAWLAPQMALYKDTKSKVAAGGFVAAAIAGPAIVAATTPLWAGGAPLVAALLVFVFVAIFGAVSVSDR